MSLLAAIQADFRDRLRAPAAADEPLGLTIYRGTYLAQKRACLADTFPRTAALAGDGFAALCDDFIAAHPAQSWSLDHYPAGFAPWLAAQGADGAWVDLARLEWAQAQAFVAPDAAVLTVADLGTVDWEAAQLALAPGAQVLPMRAETMLVWRCGHDVYLRPLAPGEAILAAPGFTFGAVCAASVAAHGEADGIARAGALLAQWAHEGVLVLA